jgi:DNA-directed RNA polymerase specialized sigma24 family protein
MRRRDGRGFDLAYERYAERIFGFLVRLSRSRALAEDLLQHTFLRLFGLGAARRRRIVSLSHSLSRASSELGEARAEHAV